MTRAPEPLRASRREAGEAMRTGNFVHLHNHSQFSLLDGAQKIEEMVDQAVAFQMPAVAITDHGNLFGAIRFFEKCREKGIRPVLGCEVYVAPRGRSDRTPPREGEKPYHHLILLAENRTGYQNLLQLVTRAYLDGFYYKPRIDRQLLSEHSEGLIGTSACLGGEVASRLLRDDADGAERAAKTYLEIFGRGNFFLEVQDQGIPEEKKVNRGLLEIARNLDLPLVGTNDCHFLRRDDHFAHQVLVCIQTGKTVKDPERLKYTQEHYFKSAEDMVRVLGDFPEAAANTLRIAERCDLDLTLTGNLLPQFAVPDGETVEGHFEKVVRRGFEERLPEWERFLSRELLRHPLTSYRERLESEIRMVVSMGFPGYFLIVWDFIKFARERGIPVGPGRGSAAGSLVAYCLRITDIDPLQYGLIFERFLNPERVSLPDIDIDFCMRRRGEVIDYVRKKYGQENVAQIITFGTMAARAVIRDAGRGLDIAYHEVDRIAKLVPAELDATVEKALASVPSLRAAYEGDEKLRQLLDVAKRLEGLARHASTHAAGVVISPRPIVEFAPLCTTKDDEVITQYAKDEIEKIGLLKMDFLGLKTLTLLEDCQARVRADRGVSIDFASLSLEDPETYALFCRAQTSGVFQFESSGMQDILRKLQPDRFEDLIALNALYRPGPIKSGMIEEYIRGRHGKGGSAALPRLREILDETYGVIVYQEQVMRIASVLAGFSLGEADLLRRAMGKKKQKEMDAQRPLFLKGARERGVKEKDAVKIFDLMAQFAGYGFNKSHSAAYALIAYRTAYLKARFPVQFMASLLTVEKEATENVVKYVNECREMGIAVHPPDINRSELDFSVEADSIRFGLGAIKNVGDGSIEAILAARSRVATFESLAHLCREVDGRALNRKALESLVKSGALDPFGSPRAETFRSLDACLGRAQQELRDQAAGQASLFAEARSEAGPAFVRQGNDWSPRERLAFEKETLGFYVSGHPLLEHRETLAALKGSSTRGLTPEAAGRSVSVPGIITGLRKRKTRKGDWMAVFHLEDLEGAVETLIFPELYRSCQQRLEEDAAVVVRGKAELEDGRWRLIAEEISPLAGALERKAIRVVLEVNASGLQAERVEEARRLLSLHPGACPLEIRLTEPGAYRLTLVPEADLRVSPTPALTEALEQVLGKGSVQYR
ncbi:MAG TPA: DNA polymerase III subunit alpha [Candidatus Polarisedimenticolia bacterium]|nr:DNA polymerase III subunit alpha [Candidatus Polarisedimenticolia bacterium]